MSACRAPGQVLLLLLPLPLAASCQQPGRAVRNTPMLEAAPRKHASDELTEDESPENGRPRIQSRPLAIALFPVQLLPDIATNANVALYPGNLWPIQYLLYPISVPYWGLTDAWEGRPFWDPSALHE